MSDLIKNYKIRGIYGVKTLYDNEIRKIMYKKKAKKWPFFQCFEKNLI